MALIFSVTVEFVFSCLKYVIIVSATMTKDLHGMWFQLRGHTASKGINFSYGSLKLITVFRIAHHPILP